MVSIKPLWINLFIIGVHLLSLMIPSTQGYSIGAYVDSAKKKEGKQEICYRADRGPFIEPIDPELEDELAQKPCE